MYLSRLTVCKINCLLISGASQVALAVENLPTNAGDVRDAGSISESEDLWRRPWQSSPVLLPGESHRQRSLAGYGPQGRTESDMTEVSTHSKWGNEITEKEQKTCSVSSLRHFIKFEENQQNLYTLIPAVILYMR